MPKLIDADFGEQFLLPPSVEDWVGPDHPARFVRELVAQLNLEALGFVQPAEGDEGRPAYAPALMLRLWLYGYMCRIRSTRRLEAAARDQMPFVWLCGRQAPDHNSLWRFWKANRKALREVFKQSVRVAMDLKLVGLVLQAIDGTKIAARSGGEEGWDEAALNRRLLALDELVNELEAQLEKAAEAEAALPADALRQLARAGQLRGAVAEALARVQAKEVEHRHPLEPEAARMPTRGGGKPFAYNAQVVVDAQSRIITAAEVMTEVNDDHHAQPLMEQAEANTQGASAEAETLADGGYASHEGARQALESGRSLLTPMPAGHGPEQQAKAFHISKFSYNADRDTVSCPQGRELPLRRLRAKPQAGGEPVMVREYRSARVCAGCPYFRAGCTRDRHGRTIEIAPGHQAVHALRQRLADPAHSAVLAQRGRIVETVFAWIKGLGHDAFRRFTARGLDNVRTQWAMLCTARNLQTIHKTWAAARSLTLQPA